MQKEKINSISDNLQETNIKNQKIGSNQQISKTSGKDKNIHKGHRERIRNRFISTNGSDFEDHELLEMLLFYVNSRVNTNGIAHNLIEEFGSLRGVCNASPDRLTAVDGVGESTALFFSILFEIRRRIRMEKYSQNKFTASSLSAVGEYLMAHYSGMNHEQFCAMLLDSSFKLIEFKAISNGSVNSSSFDVRSFARYALSKDASFVVLSHNHPSGDCTVSSADMEVSNIADAALSSINIVLLEHIIVGNASFMPTLQLRTKGMRLPSSGDNIKPDVLRKFYNS